MKELLINDGKSQVPSFDLNNDVFEVFASYSKITKAWIFIALF